MTTPRKITAVTACTTCGSLYEGMLLGEETLPCGHKPDIAYIDEAVVEAMSKETDPARQLSSKANVRMLIAYGRAQQLRRLSQWIGLLLTAALWLIGEHVSKTNPGAGTIFTAMAVATCIMDQWKSYPGMALVSAWANRLCPPRAYDKITGYLEG